jgi:hypothetical protein
VKRSTVKKSLNAALRSIDRKAARETAATRTLRKKRASRAQPPNPDHIAWGSTASLTGFLDRSGYRFGVVVQHVVTEWHLIGLVTRSPEVGQNSGQALDAVLAHHAHQNLGAFDSLDGETGALAAARRFLLDSPVPEAACGCEEVGFTPSGPDP